MYGWETWVLSGRDKSKVGAIGMKYLRRVKGFTRKYRIRSDDIRIELKVISMLQYIEQRQLEWWGLLHRLRGIVSVKEIWESRTGGNRKRDEEKRKKLDGSKTVIT